MSVSVPALGKVLVNIRASGKAPAGLPSASGGPHGELGANLTNTLGAGEETQPKEQAKDSGLCERHLADLSQPLLL